MADDTEPTSGKKHRVIHWNPDAGKETAKRRWTLGRILKVSVGGFFALLLVAAVITRSAKLIFGPNVFGTQPVATGGPAARNDPNAAFVSQGKAEAERGKAIKNQALVKKTPGPVVQQVDIEKDMVAAQAALDDNDFSNAHLRFQAVNVKMTEYMASATAKDEAQRELAIISVRLKDLEIGRSLAPDALEAATTAASTGQLLLKEGGSITAKHTLDEGLAQLKKVEQAIADHIGSNLQAGGLALTKGDKAGATTAFNAVLEKSPGNEAAMTGLKRAATIDRVHALLLQGADLEKLGRFTEAAESYKKAFELDALSAAAQAGQSRAIQLDKDTRFNTAFNAAKAAAASRDWDRVVTEANAALKVYPQRTEVQAMLRSAREEAHNDAVKKGLQKGYAHEKMFEWTLAQNAFSDVLKIEPDNADAKTEFLYCGELIRVLLEFEARVSAAERLAGDGEFQNAIGWYNRAMEIKPAYLTNSERLIKLQARLKEQNQKVTVTIESDGSTFVSMQGSTSVFQPTKLTKATYQVAPGNYELKGSKKGFKDVVMRLQVRFGEAVPIVKSVICSTPVARM